MMDDNSSSYNKRFRSEFDNGRSKRRNTYPSHDQSSMDTKPVDTLYRILCPVEKIGNIIGRGGDIVKAIRRETRANIRVADLIPGAEERVVIVFDYLSQQEVDNKVDSKNDDGNDLDSMKPCCPAHDALMKVHDRIVANEYVRGGVVHVKADCDEAVTLRVLVCGNQVGSLIGKGGSVIQKLRSDYTGVDIRILSGEHLPPCAMRTDHLVQLSGLPGIVKKALYDVSKKLHQHPHKDNPSIDELMYVSTRGLLHDDASMQPSRGHSIRSDSYGTPPRCYGGHMQYGYPLSACSSRQNESRVEALENFCIRILCRTEKIGGVIGKGGCIVKELEDVTRARIRVEDASSNAEERIINISSAEAYEDRISPTIDAVLQLQFKTSATSDGTVTTRLLVPSSKVGCLLGQQGSIIKEMRRRTGGDIRVFFKEDKPTYISEDEELVQISGDQHVAREALLEILSRLRSRSFESGDREPVFSERRFAPPESFSSRGYPSSNIIRDAEFSPPQHRYRDDRSSRGPPSFDMSRAGNAIGYEYSEGRGTRYEASSYHGGAPYESSSLRYRDEPTYAPPSYLTRPTYDEQDYRGPPPASSRYSIRNSSSAHGSVEVRIPNYLAHSVLGEDDSNINDICKISGARVVLYDSQPGSSESVVDIHGSSEQIKTAQSLLQAFIYADGPTRAGRPGQQQRPSSSYR